MTPHTKNRKQRTDRKFFFSSSLSLRKCTAGYANFRMFRLHMQKEKRLLSLLF